MKHKKFKLYFALALLMMFAGLNTPNYAASMSQVDVGILYGQNNQFPIGVTSEDGFVMTFELPNSTIQTIDFSNYKSLLIFKDGYYEPSGRTLITTNESYYTNGQVKGGFHLQIGESIATYDEAVVLLADLQAVINDVYLVYDDSWHIFQGTYLNADMANAQIIALSPLVKGKSVSLVEPVPTRVIVATKDKILFGFDSSFQKFIFHTSIFDLNGVKYRNSFYVNRLPGSDFTFVNRVTMKEYLYGVLPKEASSDWPIEALKAQAVASKNFALTIGAKYAAYGFDVDTTVNSQVYGGYSVEKEICNRAVDETDGFALAYDGKLIPLYFHSSSGGITDNSENVWSSALPYLKSTFDPYSLGAPNTDWNVTMNKFDIENKLILAGYNVGSLKTINILNRAESGRVLTLEFIGTLGKATLAKDKIRSVLGSSVIKSNLFSFDKGTAITDVAGLKNSSGASQPVTSQGMVDIGGNMPKTLIADGAIYGQFVDTTQIDVYHAGNKSEIKVDKDALLKATDIYKAQATVTKPYLYNSTESFDISSGNVIFYGHGYGHGLGMSQWGAKAMADVGKSYEEILKYYYQNTELIKLDE